MLRRAVIIAATTLAVWTWAADARALPNRTGKPSESSPAERKGGDIGLGVSLGDPTGATFKIFFTERHTLESALGFGPFHLGGGRLHVAYLYHSRAWRESDEIALHGYVGAGIGVAFWARDFVGPFTPDKFHRASFMPLAPILGLAWHFKKIAMDIFLETAYSPLVGPPLTFWNFDLALGARYWF